MVASLFAELGCRVINSDAMVHEAYAQDAVKRVLQRWWGAAVFNACGQVDRRAVAKRVFADPAQRRRLEKLLHPLIDRRRRRLMKAAAAEAAIVAFVWDAPLLYETGLNRLCKAMVFVDAPRQERLRRVAQERGWNVRELDRREKSQLPLDKKREISDYVLCNTADADYARSQVREILSRILHGLSGCPQETRRSPTF